MGGGGGDGQNGTGHPLLRSWRRASSVVMVSMKGERGSSSFLKCFFLLCLCARGTLITY